MASPQFFIHSARLFGIWCSAGLIVAGIGCAPAVSVSPEVKAGPCGPFSTESDSSLIVNESGAGQDSVDALKKAILIFPFRDESKYDGPWHVYGQLAKGLADTLQRFESYQVITPEAGFIHLNEDECLGQIESARAVHLGRQLKADVVVLGEISEISMKRFRATVPLGGYRSYQGLTQIKLFFYNAIDGQLAGECECDVTVDSKRTGVINPAAHVPLEREYFFLGEAVWGSEEFHQTLVGQSVGKCLHELGSGVEATIRPAPELNVSEPKIIDIDGVRAYINVGSADGVQNGDKFGVWDHGRELRDPDSNAVLGYAVPRRVGVIQIDQILNDHLSQVRILDGAGEIQTTFLIRAE